jgi:Uma2 family endonuclease
MAILAKDEEYIPRYSYEDYEQWEGKWELVGGIAYAMSPAPIIRHQEVSSNIDRELYKWLESCQKCKSLMAVDWKISHKTVVCPDNLIVCGEEIGEKYLIKTPEIIFEILSPSTAFKDRNVKSKLYQKMGVTYYILVDTPAQTAEVFLLVDGEYQKIKNAQDDIIKFELENCKIDFDFENIWI